MAVSSNTGVQQAGMNMAAREEASPASRVRDALFSAARRLRDNESVLRATLRTFQLLQKLGVSIVPNHY